MNGNSAASFFDDIIRTLTVESESAKFANISREVLDEFFAETDIPSPASVDVPESSYNTPPPQQQAQENQPQAPAPVQPAFSAESIAAMDWNTLHAAASACMNCPLYSERRNVVFGAGRQNAELMFIGEGPGREEDEQGIPFVGAAGQLLTKMINAMQYARSDVYIANIIKCRPPNNRNPEDEEAAACLPFLKRQIELVQPKVIVLLGAVPLLHLLGRKGITRLRGTWMEYNGIKVMPTFHPAYLLRNPSAKRDVWQDLQKVMQLLGKHYSPVQKR